MAFSPNFFERSCHQLDFADGFQRTDLPEFGILEFDLARFEFDFEITSANFQVPNVKEHGTPTPASLSAGRTIIAYVERNVSDAALRSVVFLITFNCYGQHLPGDA